MLHLSLEKFDDPNYGVFESTTITSIQTIANVSHPKQMPHLCIVSVKTPLRHIVSIDSLTAGDLWPSTDMFHALLFKIFHQRRQTWWECAHRGRLKQMVACSATQVKCCLCGSGQLLSADVAGTSWPAWTNAMLSLLSQVIGCVHRPPTPVNLCGL